MSRYRRAQVPGATYFFTVNLRNRRSDLRAHRIGLLRETVRAIRACHTSPRRLGRIPNTCIHWDASGWRHWFHSVLEVMLTNTPRNEWIVHI